HSAPEEHCGDRRTGIAGWPADHHDRLAADRLNGLGESQHQAVMVDYERRLAPFRDTVLQADIIHIEAVHRRQLSRALVGGATVSRLAPAPCSQPPRLCAARSEERRVAKRNRAVITTTSW